MALDDIITETAAILETVANVGKVNAYRRAVNTEADVAAAYKDEATGMIRAWDVTRESTQSNDRTVGATEELHLIVLRGYLSVKDAEASERTFQNLIEAIRGAFRAKRNLNGKALDSTPMNARTVTAASLSGILVHYCELAFTVQEFPLSTA
jgi:hypothetical protein